MPITQVDERTLQIPRAELQALVDHMDGPEQEVAAAALRDARYDTIWLNLPDAESALRVRAAL